MNAYIINLDSAHDRWKYVEQHYGHCDLTVVRVAGVDGRTLESPIENFNEGGYRRWHGQTKSVGQIGCYFSHLKCLQLFLSSSEEVAVIAEDDARPVPEIADIVHAAQQYECFWDILRLCGTNRLHAVAYASLTKTYSIGVCYAKLCGTGAYAVNRQAAKVLLKQLTPMWLPIDHAIDKEWAYGLRASVVMPLPYSQLDNYFESQTLGKKIPWYQRYWTVTPYRIKNELQRAVHRHFTFQHAKRRARQMVNGASCS